MKKNLPLVKTKNRKGASTRPLFVAPALGIGVLRPLHLLSHQHTGKLLHHRHTSHGVLVVMLLIVGLFLFASIGVTRAVQQIESHAVAIDAIVAGPAPTVGATIVSPADGAVIVDQDTTTLSGSCLADSFVVVYSNGSIIGSTLCSVAGVFTVSVQLSGGTQLLTAKNFDSLNQAGPDTGAVSVTVSRTGSQAPPLQAPTLPDNPSTLPGQVITGRDNFGGALAGGTIPRIAVVSIPRQVDTRTSAMLGIVIWGGSPGYALDIIWGDGSKNTLASVTSVGYHSFPFRYDTPGVYTIVLRVTDAAAQTAYVQTALRINGPPETFLGGIGATLVQSSWFETPVPLYLLALAVTLGFWGGDLFDRRFGAVKTNARRRKTA